MPPPTTGEPGQTCSAAPTIPAHWQIFINLLTIFFAAVTAALRDILIAKTCAWLLFHIGLYEYYIPAWMLFLFGQSSWLKAAIIVRRLISRDGADDELISHLGCEIIKVVYYVFMSLLFHNISAVWGLAVRGILALFWMIKFIILTVIMWNCGMDNSTETFNTEAIRVWSLIGPRIARLWDFSQPKVLAFLQRLRQTFLTTIHYYIRFYIKGRASLITYRDKRTVEITTALEEYKYSALNPGQIRLLRLSKWTLASPVLCELIHVRLNDAPEFEAISYTWGARRVLKRLILNGRRFDVSERVYEIIHDRASSFMTRFIWIDSICINQGDNDEKSCQVQLMRDIYRSSCYTVVWLGHAPDANDAIGFLAHLRLRIGLDDPNRRASLPLTELNIDRPEWPALINLIKHDYWVRCWIIQEIAVSKKIILSYGGEMITWEHFSSVMKALFHSDPNSVWHISKTIWRTADPTPYPMDAGLQIISLENIRGAIQQNQSLKLFDILIAGIRSMATDPRDSIFALQGISAEAKSGDITPDYNLPLEQLFLETAKYLLRQEHPSRLLHLAGIGYYRNIKLQISWVPDWSTPRLSAMYWRYPTDSPYRSSGIFNEHRNMLLGPDGLTLILSGIRVDCIKKLGPTFFGASENGIPKTSRFPGDIQTFVETRNIALRGAMTERYPTGISLAEAFWRTLIGDKTPTGTRPAQTSFFACYQAAERYFDVFSKLGLGSDIDLLSIDLSRPEAQEALDIVASGAILDGGRFFNISGPHLRERRFAITDRGYMGVVPPYSEIGDVLFIIPGTQVPFLLRSQRGGDDCRDVLTVEKWRLVGESYFHGMMDGEAKKNGCTEQLLEIC